MTSGNLEYIIRTGQPSDIDAIKHLTDQHKFELGFIVRGALVKSATSSELLVAVRSSDSQFCGFLQYRHRKDQQTTLYNIAVDSAYREQGIAHQLVGALVAECLSKGMHHIQLKCPVSLPANEFYSRYGFTLIEMQKGKFRPLNIWRLDLRE